VPDRLDDLLLIVSELIANSVHHAGTAATLELTVYTTDATLRISLRDEGRRSPDDWRLDQASDRLRLVEQLADGLSMNPREGIVTVELRRT
jgi:signal transduction histidine kinase